MGLLSALSVAAVTALCYGFVRLVQVRRLGRDLPQPPHSFWFGHLRLLGELAKAYPHNTYIHHFLISIARDYDFPDIFYLDLWPFSKPTLVVCNHELVAQMTTERNFAKDSEVEKYLRPFLGKHSIISVNGPQWKALHAIFAPAFSPAYIRSMADGMVDEVLLMHNRLTQMAKSGETFSATELNINMTFNVIGRAIFNSPFHNEEGESTTAIFRKGLDYAFKSGLDRIQKLRYVTRTRSIVRKIDQYIKGKVTQRFDELKNEDQSVIKKSKSVMDLVLRQRLDTPGGIAGDREFMNVATSNIKSFLVAGHETTAFTLGFAYMLLSKNPEVLRKVREEHDRVFDPDFQRTVEMIRTNPEKLYDLHYTTGIIKETLRLFPIGSVARTATKDLPFFYKGKELPIDGFMILVCNLAMHYNPEIFPAPTKFQPERYTTQEIPKDAWRPFERGYRRCIGQDLAMMEMRIVLLLVLRTFDFETVGANPYKNPAAKYTDLDTVYGDLAFQRMALTARPKGGQDMKVSFASGQV
ncbi:hypothetical protein FQN55_004188 [Onygenales sp. PD_40]|nr:hypothetical protein FQN55_004188 [Onygenales sp. PD_40]